MYGKRAGSDSERGTSKRPRSSDAGASGKASSNIPSSDAVRQKAKDAQKEQLESDGQKTQDMDSKSHSTKINEVATQTYICKCVCTCQTPISKPRFVETTDSTTMTTRSIIKHAHFFFPRTESNFGSCGNDKVTQTWRLTHEEELEQRGHSWSRRCQTPSKWIHTVGNSDLLRPYEEGHFQSEGDDRAVQTWKPTSSLQST